VHHEYKKREEDTPPREANWLGEYHATPSGGMEEDSSLDRGGGEGRRRRQQSLGVKRAVHQCRQGGEKNGGKERKPTTEEKREMNGVIGSLEKERKNSDHLIKKKKKYPREVTEKKFLLSKTDG